MYLFVAIKRNHKSKARERERTKVVSLERRASRSCNGHVETCEYRLKPKEDKKLAARKKKVSWDKFVDQKTAKTKAKDDGVKRKEAKRVLEKSDKARNYLF